MFQTIKAWWRISKKQGEIDRGSFRSLDAVVGGDKHYRWCRDCDRTFLAGLSVGHCKRDNHRHYKLFIKRKPVKH
jgi:hypothetical protein